MFLYAQYIYIHIYELATVQVMKSFIWQHNSHGPILHFQQVGQLADAAMLRVKTCRDMSRHIVWHCGSTAAEAIRRHWKQIQGTSDDDGSTDEELSFTTETSGATEPKTSSIW